MMKGKPSKGAYMPQVDRKNVRGEGLRHLAKGVGEIRFERRRKRKLADAILDGDLNGADLADEALSTRKGIPHAQWNVGESSAMMSRALVSRR